MEAQLPGQQVCKKLGRGSQESADKRDLPSPPGTVLCGVGWAPGARVCDVCTWGPKSGEPRLPQDTLLVSTREGLSKLERGFGRR